MSTDVNVPYLIHPQIATNKLTVETKSVSMLLFEPKTSFCFVFFKESLVYTRIGGNYHVISFKLQPKFACLSSNCWL